MKKFCTTFYLFAMALAVFAMSGCGGSSNKPPETTAQSAQNRRMIFTSSALKRNGNYSLFRGDKVGTLGLSGNPKYYLAPVTRGTENITLNLEFDSAVSQDLPFMITDADDSTVLFYYNPKGTGEDTTTASVTRYGGATQKLSYSNLTLTASSIDLDDSNAISIVLNSDGTATAGGTAIPSYDYVWHADPQHPAEYWTLGANGTTELDSDAYEDAIEAAGTNNGLYIARDIRYTPNTLDFSTSKTAKKDEDTEYVVYYDFTSSAVKSALSDVVSKYGSAYSSDKYIFATLPMSVGGMGGMPGDMNGNPGGMPSGDMTPPGGMQSGDRPTPPGGETRLPVMGFSAADSTASSIASFATMTHSSADAYANPVLHITTPGVYKISGTWKGQIWVETSTKASNPDSQVAIILNGVDVECKVAPALVFYKVYKWAEENGYDNQSTLSANDLWKNIGGEMISSDGYYSVGAIVEIADGTTNTFKGANLYRILELCPKLTDSGDEEVPKYTGSGIGTDISEQEKMYKLDAAFHSRRSMVIGGGSAGTGTLNITSTTYEGLDSEMHMLVNGGNISVTAPDDGINVNEDYVSVFAMDDGTLTINSTGGDGIDSNGWVAINYGTLNITAGSQAQGSAGEAGIDAENGVYISPNATYNYYQANTNGGSNTPPSGGDNSTNTNTNTETDTNTDTGTDQTTTYSVIPVTETTQSIGNGAAVFTLFPSDSSVEVDTEGERTIPSSGNSFTLQHRVNDFAGIK